MHKPHELNITESRFPQVATELTVLETSLAAAALCVIILLTIIGNCTICFVVLKNKRMWTVMNFFLVNLAVGDLAVGFLSMIFPMVTAVKRKWIFNGTVCQINAACNSVLFCSTIFIHTVISIDRYFALVRPMKKFMTGKKAFIMILSVWVLSVLIVLGPFFGWGHMEFNPTTLQCGYGFPRSKYESLYMILLVMVAFVIPLLVMTGLYLRIFCSMRGHSRRMSISVARNQHQTTLKAQIRVGATFFLALLAFFVCWTPFCAFIAFAVIVKNRANIPHGLGLAAYLCGFVNSLCNPFILGLRSDQFRRAFMNVLCCCGEPRPRREPRKPSMAQSQRRQSKMADRNRSQSNTDSADTRVTESTLAKGSTNHIYAVSASQSREELDCDSAQNLEVIPDYNSQNGMDDIISHSPKTTRKLSSTKRDRPQDTGIPYKLFIHVIGDLSFRESGV